MIDIHAHILPGLDDGPRTMEESVRMCEMCIEQGVSVVVATPHMCNPRFSVSAEDVRSRVGELSEACRRRGLNIEILPGGDVLLQPGLLEAMDAGDALTLADTGKYLLLELPAQTVPSIEGLVFELALRGVTPILTHPERNPAFHHKPGRLVQLVESGCYVQITGDSLLGRFGRGARRAGGKFLKSGLVHVVASDAHSARDRRPALGTIAGLLSSMAGEDAARRLLCDHPARIIRGEPLESPADDLPGPEKNEGRGERREETGDSFPPSPFPLRLSSYGGLSDGR